MVRGEQFKGDLRGKFIAQWRWAEHVVREVMAADTIAALKTVGQRGREWRDHIQTGESS